jgi:hypothetical protein
MLLDWLGFNYLPVHPVDRTKMPGAPPPMERYHDPQFSPFWLMIPLWILLAVLVGVMVWMLFKLLLENIAAWRREVAGIIVPERRRLRRLDLRFLLAAALSLARFMVDRLKRWHGRRHPRDLSVLYEAFILWGRRNRLPRRRWETPGTYLHRLEPKVASTCPNLLPALQDLTRRYEQYCYGQNGDAGLIGEEWTLARRLRSARLHQKKLLGFIPAPAWRGHRK